MAIEVHEQIKKDIVKFAEEMKVEPQEVASKFTEKYPKAIELGKSLFPIPTREEKKDLNDDEYKELVNEIIYRQQDHVLGCVRTSYTMNIQRTSSEPQVVEMAVIERREAETFKSGKTGNPSIVTLLKVPGLTKDEFEFGEIRPDKSISKDDRQEIMGKIYNNTEVNKVYNIELSAFRGRGGLIVPLLTSKSFDTLKENGKQITTAEVLKALSKAFGSPVKLQNIVDHPKEHIGTKRRLFVVDVAKPYRAAGEEGGRFGYYTVLDGSLKKSYVEENGGVTVKAYYSQIRKKKEARLAIVGGVSALWENGEVYPEKFGAIDVRDFDVNGFIYDIEGGEYKDEPKEGEKGTFNKEEITGGTEEPKADETPSLVFK
jgi:hypothetical protein